MTVLLNLAYEDCVENTYLFPIQLQHKLHYA